MINLCLVVIATQFSETKKRETAKMKAERAKYSSSSTLSSLRSRSDITTLLTDNISILSDIIYIFINPYFSAQEIIMSKSVKIEIEVKIIFRYQC